MLKSPSYNQTITTDLLDTPDTSLGGDTKEQMGVQPDICGQFCRTKSRFGEYRLYSAHISAPWMQQTSKFHHAIHRNLSSLIGFG